MPFTEPYRKSYEPGDLIYGVESARKRYMMLSNPFAAAPGNMPTIDEHAILKVEIEAKKSKGVKPTAGEKNFVYALKEHSKYNQALHGPDTNAAVRLKTKGGLYWATLVEGKHVHFILDEIDIMAVVEKNNTTKNKDKPATATEPKNRSVTGSELRWVYRNREHPKVRGFIQFWFDFKPVPPPWIQYARFDFQTQTVVRSTPNEAAGLWSAYRPKKEYVHNAKTATE
jgi:hypothetical protein